MLYGFLYQGEEESGDPTPAIAVGRDLVKVLGALAGARTLPASDPGEPRGTNVPGDGRAECRK